MSRASGAMSDGGRALSQSGEPTGLERFDRKTGLDRRVSDCAGGAAVRLAEVGTSQERAVAGRPEVSRRESRQGTSSVRWKVDSRSQVTIQCFAIIQ